MSLLQTAFRNHNRPPVAAAGPLTRQTRSSTNQDAALAASTQQAAMPQPAVAYNAPARNANIMNPVDNRQAQAAMNTIVHETPSNRRGLFSETESARSVPVDPSIYSIGHIPSQS